MMRFWPIYSDGDASDLYNSLLPFEQTHDVPVALLQEFGSVFVRHGVHTSSGPSLLRRHHYVPSGMRMIYTSKTINGSEVVLCRAQTCDNASCRMGSTRCLVLRVCFPDHRRFGTKRPGLEPAEHSQHFSITSRLHTLQLCGECPPTNLAC